MKVVHSIVVTSLSSLIFGNRRVIRYPAQPLKESQIGVENYIILLFYTNDCIFTGVAIRFISESKDCFIVKKFIPDQWAEKLSR